ncbi:MAG: response regulator transcription factor [Dehalococcoidales bacterium]|nr:response regulator transcription factor [Dehalococcoidales bacterium]
MPEELSNAGPYRELILKLLRQSAKDRAASQRWSITSVALLGGIFVVIILLNFQPVDRWVVAAIALLGLVVLWIFTSIRSRNLEKKFYQQGLRDYGDILSDKAQSGTGEEPPAKPLEIPLTERELDILSKIADGDTNKAIAHAFNVNESSIKNQVSRILRKLDVSNRTEAVLLALSRGWLKKDSDNG